MKHAAKKIAPGVYTYRGFTCTKQPSLPGRFGFWMFTRGDGKSYERNTLGGAKESIDNRLAAESSEVV